jgi:hypothetical protein
MRVCWYVNIHGLLDSDCGEFGDDGILTYAQWLTHNCICILPDSLQLGVVDVRPARPGVTLAEESYA